MSRPAKKIVAIVGIVSPGAWWSGGGSYGLRDRPSGLRDDPHDLRDGPSGLRDGLSDLRNGPPGLRDRQSGRGDGLSGWVGHSHDLLGSKNMNAFQRMSAQTCPGT